MKVYIVEGSTGEYSDRFDWTVNAFTSWKKAEALCNDLNAFLIEHKVHMTDTPTRQLQTDYNYTSTLKNPLDPRAYYDYTGTVYMMYELEVDTSN